LLGENDEIADNEETKKFYGKLQVEDKQMETLPGTDHFQMFLDEDYQLVQKAALDFFLKRI